MQKLALAALLLFSVVSCKTDPKNQIASSEKSEAKTNFPKLLAEVFKTHGGLDNWKNMKSLSFSMKRENGVETTVTNL